MASDNSDAIRERCVQAMKRIIATNKDVTSRVKFALLVHTTPARINAWEKGTGSPTLENVHAICKEFNVSAAWLIMDEGKMFGSAEFQYRLRELEKRVSNLEMQLK